MKNIIEVMNMKDGTILKSSEGFIVKVVNDGFANKLYVNDKLNEWKQTNLTSAWTNQTFEIIK